MNGITGSAEGHRQIPSWTGIHNAYEISTNETNLRKMYDSKKLKRLVDEIEA